MKEKMEAKENGITLVALVVTIVVLLILAGITITYVFGDNGVFGKASEAKLKTEIAKAREKIEIVLGEAQIPKHTDDKYNKNEYLDEFILSRISNTEVLDEMIITDGYAFDLDRSVPKIGEYIGKKEDLVFPNVSLEVALAPDKKSATITIKAKEEKNGINKIEIWQAGEKLEEYTYNNEKEEITKEYIAKQNGDYVVKVYAKLSARSIAKVTGILASVKFEPNGNTEWKKSHSSKVTIEETGERIVNAKYYWSNSITEPTDDKFTQTFNSGDTVTESSYKLTGTYYLWTMLGTSAGEKVKWRSEGFKFDNEGPTITSFTATKYSATGITLSATAQDKKSGIVKFEFYIDGVLKDGYTQTMEATTENVTKTVNIAGLTTGNHNCEVRAYDVEGNSSKRSASGATKLYTWEKWSVTQTHTYKVKTGDMESMRRVLN